MCNNIPGWRPCGLKSLVMFISTHRHLPRYYSIVINNIILSLLCRSAVFICDNPGSIAASIAHTKSGSDIQAMLLKKLSSGGSVDTKDEQGKNVEAINTTPKKGERIKSASRASKRGSLSGRRRYSISATSIRNVQYSQGSLVASKSASSTLSTKKSGEHAPSKQVTSNCPMEDDVI